MSTAKNAVGAMPPSPPARRPQRPRTHRRVISELGEVVVKVKTGELDSKRANALIYALSTLAGVITTSEVERRLAELERFLKPAAAQPWRPGLLRAPGSQQ